MTTDSTTESTIVARDGMFNGRMGRLNFFIGTALAILIFGIGFLVLFWTGLILAIASSGYYGIMIIPALVFVAIYLLLATSMAARRLHDMGQSGLWLFIYALFGFSIFLLPLQWLFNLVLIFAEGEAKSNKYGPVPQSGFDLKQTWLNKTKS